MKKANLNLYVWFSDLKNPPHTHFPPYLIFFLSNFCYARVVLAFPPLGLWATREIPRCKYIWSSASGKALMWVFEEGGTEILKNPAGADRVEPAIPKGSLFST